MGIMIPLEEAAELLGISVFELKLSRQKGLPPGKLGVVREGRLEFDTADLIHEPRTKRETAEEQELPEEKSSPIETVEPQHVGAGWYVLSNGEKIRGKKEAYKAQLELEG